MGKYSNLLSEKVQENLENYIEENNLSAGDVLPSERTLAAELGVNRQTLRTALHHMKNEHRIYTIQGKGNFISPDKYTDDTSELYSFSEGWGYDGYDTSSKIINFRIIEAPIDICTGLEMTLGSEVYQLQRIRYLNEEPLIYETSFLPAHLFNGLDKYDFEKFSLYETLRIHYKMPLIKMDERITITTLSSDEKNYLKAEDDLAFLFHSIAYNEDNRPVEYCISVACASMLKLSSNMYVDR